MSWEERFATDLFYIKTISFINDTLIIFKTIQKVVKKENILVGKEHVLKNFDTERKDRIKDGNYKTE